MKSSAICLLLILLSLLDFSHGFIGDKSWPRNYLGHSCTNESLPTKIPSQDRHSFLRTLSTINCPPETNLICSSRGICECPSLDLVYVHDSLSCLPVASPENGFSCISLHQCQSSSLGRHSTCNSNTGTCDCHLWIDKKEVQSASVQLIDGVCYLSVLNRLEEAGRSININSNTLKLEWGSICESNSQCTGSPMGSLSRCNLAERKCECYDTKTNGKNEVGLYGGKCWIKRVLGEFCEADEECKFGWHSNAVCVDGDAYVRSKICSCPSEAEGGCSGDVGSGGGDGINYNVGLVLVSSALLKIMTIFV